MQRSDLTAAFGMPGPYLFPVIHVLETQQVLDNIQACAGVPVSGFFLINHDFGVDPFLPIVREVRQAHPDLWLGLNFLAVTGGDAFPILGHLGREGVRIDAYWADDARIDERADVQVEADAIDRARRDSGWSGLYFGGTAFKKQRPVAAEHYEISARRAARHMDVVTTSGVATGEAADLSKISAFRRGLEAHAMAVASGITPENVTAYHAVDCFLVATGINREGDFYTIDPDRLRRLTDRLDELRLETEGDKNA